MVIYLRWVPSTDTWNKGLDTVMINADGVIRDFARGKEHGITQKFRMAIYVIVILPKVCLTLVLWWYGCAFLLASESIAELILNSVALAFVLQIDGTQPHGSPCHARFVSTRH
jgi:hypothetical protein